MNGTRTFDRTLTRMASPLGEMLLVTDAQARVHALDFADREPPLRRRLREHDAPERAHAGSSDAVRAIIAKLEGYFFGDLTALDDIAVADQGDELQRQVWSALRRIPAGEVTTYGELARRLGHTDPRMAKAIGAANGANPIAIIVPCHRVIGKDGDLKGYAWGPHRKRWLLAHEKADIAGRETVALPGF